MNKFSKSILAIFSGMAIASSAMAFGGHGKGDCGHKGKFKNMTTEQRQAFMEKRLQRMAKKLDLSDSQVAQIKAVKSQNKTQKQSLHEQKKQLMSKLKQQRLSNDAEANIEATHDELYELKKQMRKIHRSERVQIQAIFTPEQQAKAKAMFEKKMERHSRN